MAVAVPLDPSALSVFRDAFAGEVVLPNDDGYDAARAVWNGMIDRRPVLIVRPTTVRDVAAAVRFARERDLVVAVRGGGHSIAVELVTADGRSVRASEDQNPDLFWALRGAGANFGIATAFEFRLHPFDGQVTHGFVVHPGVRAVELARLYRELLETSPDELFLGFDLGMATPEDDLPPEVAGRPVATIGVCHSGSPDRRSAMSGRYGRSAHPSSTRSSRRPTSTCSAARTRRWTGDTAST
jgi:FAD binding domain